MKVNPILTAATKFNPTKKSFQMNVEDLCGKIDTNEITLPLYQRDLSWTLQKAVDLFNYQLFGKAPVAPISINQINNIDLAVPQISFLDREVIEKSEIKNAHYSVVDGQQRLTTSYKAYIKNDDFRNIFLDVQKAKFRIIEGEVSKSQIPVGILLNKDIDVLKSYLIENKTFNDLYGILLDVRSKMNGYNYTMNVAEDLTENEQIEWFEVLNNAGSKVTTLQMAFSKLKIHNFDIYRDYIKPFISQIEDFGFEDLLIVFTTNVSYPIVALNPAYEVIVKSGTHNVNFAPIPSDQKSKQLTSLDVDILNKIVKLSLESTKKALDFIEQNNLKSNIIRMDYILYLSGYFAFNADSYGNSEAAKKLVQWVKDTDFNNASNGKRREIFANMLRI